MSTAIGPKLFAINDRVRIAKGTQVGKVTAIEAGGSALEPRWVYLVRFDNGNRTNVYADSLVPEGA